jgi:hypothetical protein
MAQKICAFRTILVSFPFNPVEQQRALFFECFPYVCPEPVLAKNDNF